MVNQMDDWQEALSVMRRHTLPYLSAPALHRAENLFSQGRVMVGRTAQLNWARRQVDEYRRAEALENLGRFKESQGAFEEVATEHPDSYEQAVNPAPDPTDWFHVRIVIASPRVSVFVGDATEPSLVVNQLSDRGKGRVGLFVGNNSGGDFANLKIVRQ